MWTALILENCVRLNYYSPTPPKETEVKNINKCKLISYDTSTNSTGYAVYLSGKFEKCDILDFKHIKNTEDRINEMILKIYEIIDKENPQIVVAEMTVVPRNVQAQRNLTMILGAIQGKCLEKNIYFYLFRPSEWRKLVNDTNEKLPRKREELKAWSKRKVLEKYNITDINDDVSDAILVGQAYINKFGE